VTRAMPALKAIPSALSRRGRRVSALFAALLVLLLAKCRKELSEPDENGLEPAPTASSTETAAPAPHVPPAAVGEWVGSKHYRLRVVSVSPCAETSALRGGQPSAQAPRDAAGRFRLGVEVEIEANAGNSLSPVFASAKAATLAKDGKIFQALLDPTATPACAALLEPKRLRPGESTRGTLVFEAPDVAYLRSAVLRFRPPRWGGELSVDVQLPDCFGSGCSEPAPALRAVPPTGAQGPGNPA
jgi:hypothetical protein